MNLIDLYEMRDPRDAYQRDYDHSVSGMGRGSDHRGLGQELAHERNNIQIAINGRPWKVVAGKGTADSAEERSYLEGMKRWAERKSASSGKKWTVYLTGAEVSEAANPAQQAAIAIAKKKAAGSLNEFAPGDGSDGGEEDALLKFARMWYNGDDATQQRVEQALARQGWEIGELESEEGGAFVVQSGDEHGDSYIGFTADDLTESMAEAAVPGVPGVAKAAPGVAPVKKGGTLPMTKKVLTPDQIKQYNAKQAAAKPAAQPLAQPAAPTATAPQRYQSSDPRFPNGKYDGVTGKPTPEYQAELNKQAAAQAKQQKADAAASQAQATSNDQMAANMNNIAAQRNMPAVPQATTPNVSTGAGAEQAAIAKMQAKNPKLAAAMQAEIDALGEGVVEGSQRVDSLVTDALKIMQGATMNDAVAALKTVLGNREYNDRRGHYSFYVRQLMDMYGQQGMAEGSETPEKEIERLKLRQNAEHGGASLKRQAETQARIRELEKAQKNQGVATEDASWGMAEGVRDLGYDAQSLIMKLRRDVEEKRLQPTPQAVLAAARELAGDMEFAPRLLVKQVLGQGVAEAEVDSDGHSVDHADSGEYDYEGDQAKDQLNTIVRAAQRLNGMLDDNENMPEWVQMKITNAADYIDTAADYIESNQEPELSEGDKVGNMDADKFDAAMARLKQLAGAGPMKTVWDPAKRVYRNIPTAVQPRK